MASSAAASRFEVFYADWGKRMEAMLREIPKLESQQYPPKQRVHEVLRCQINMWLEFYEHKAKVIEEDILYMAANLWRTPFERAFCWIGGPRPSTLFQLIYSQIGAQTSQSLAALLDGHDSSSLAFLTSSQLISLSSLQERTIGREEQLSNQLANAQTITPVQPLPPGMAGHLLMRQDSETGSSGSTADSEEVANADPAARSLALLEEATKRLQVLKRLLLEADRLRVETLQQVVSNLTEIQALHFCKGLGELWQAQKTLGEALYGNKP